MKPYNLKWCLFERWIDLDFIMHIDVPVYCGEEVTLSYQLKYSTQPTNVILYSNDRKKFNNQVFLPFLEAWKNKDVINVSK